MNGLARIFAVAALFAALILPNESFGQFTKNTNQSRKLRSVLVGGSGNLIPSGKTAAAIGGGADNKAIADYSTVGGGITVTASGYSSTAAGGNNNIASGGQATVAGGANNEASGPDATVGGGGNNTASADYATVPGGYKNTAGGDYSFAAGRRAKAQAAGAFVWADSQDADFNVSTADRFAARAAGGVYFQSGTLGLNQIVSWTPGSPAWSFTSDAETKEHFRPLDSRDILKRVSSMPINEWNYKGYEQRHIGPTAQDWHAALPLNDSDTTINTADMHGVSLAAIKGLVEELKDRDKAIEEMQSELKALREKVERVITPSP